MTASMISFKCGGCGRAFSVPASYAGRKATCKSCGTSVVVPAVGATAALPSGDAGPASASASANGAPSLPGSAGAPPRLSMRQRRLMADAAQMRKAFADFPAIRLRGTTGDPPEVYQVEYRVRGLERGADGKPVARDAHVVEIRLTGEYPRLSPVCRMLTPVFHPNIDPATICVGDHWTAGERLVDLVARIGEMIAFQAYNIKSPLDGEAAMWADLNAADLPLDPQNLRPTEE